MLKRDKAIRANNANKAMRKNLLASLASLAFVASLAFPSSFVVKRLDLNESVRLAYLNNPALLANLEDIAIAEQRLRMARHLLLPHLGFDATATIFEAGRSFVITDGFGGLILNPTDRERFYLGRGFIEQSLYTGGKNKNAIVLAKANLEKAKNAERQTKRQVLKDVRIRFLESLRLREQIRTRRELKGLLDHWGGSSSLWTQLWLDDKKAQIEDDLEEIVSKESKDSKAALLKAIGMDLSSEIEIAGNLRDLVLPKKAPTLQEALSWAREFRPEYKATALESEMDATQVAIALASRNPVVNLAGMYEFLGNEFPLRQNNWSAMLRVHLPLSWDNWATIREHKAQQRKGQVKRVDVEDKIALEVRQAHAEFLSHLEKLSRLEKRLRRWDEIAQDFTTRLKDEEARFKFFERYEELKRRRVEALHETLASRYELEYAVGRDLE